MENPVAKKLDALLKLQEVDSQIDEIKKVRGDLPDEVQDLEDEIAGLKTRIEKVKSEISDLEGTIGQNNILVKDAKALIEKYEVQQQNVRNNREYDAITKEIELQDLEIKLANKRNKEHMILIEKKETRVQEIEEKLQDRNADLDVKKSELNEIMSETAIEEEKLLEKRAGKMKDLEERLYNSYMRIRTNARNGLAVVKVERDACGGCFNIVPPQRQSDIRERKKLIVCEHCGRVLADVILHIEEEKTKRPRRKTTRKTTKKAKAAK